MDLVIRPIGTAITMAITRMAMAINRTDTTGHIGTMVITGDPGTTGTTGIEFTATTVIIITIGTKLA